MNQQKTPPPVLGSGVKNSATKLKPDCRAGQQRVTKQQVQIAIHALNLAMAGITVKWFSEPAKTAELTQIKRHRRGKNWGEAKGSLTHG